MISEGELMSDDDDEEKIPRATHPPNNLIQILNSSSIAQSEKSASVEVDREMVRFYAPQVDQSSLIEGSQFLN